ncbi:UMP kinase [Buchnera aphidicola]|uniref:UMP kinase n=1 Tax=Buchnera aphidicola TaxID=9 RepID=UPI003463F448
MQSNTKPIYRRILLKISGQTLQKNIDGFGIDIQSIDRIAKEIKILFDYGVEIGLVIGGGNLFRGLHLKKLGVNKIISDQIGILSTIINSLAVKDAIDRASMDVRLMSAIKINGICEIYNYEKAIRLLSNRHVVIFSAGIGNPLFTTDSAACLRGIEIQADILLKGTKVNGVYDLDPEKHLNAVMYKQLSYHTVLEKEFQVMDLSAFTLARDHSLPIRVFNINKSGALHRIILGENEGTLITASNI